MYTYYGTSIRCLPAEKGGADKILTRKIDYFRASAPSHANERKTETSGLQAHPREPPLQGSQKAPISPLYDTNRGPFSAEKCPWIENSTGWIARSMGRKQKSKGWMACAAARTHEKSAKRRRNPRVRINRVTYSAQRRATVPSWHPPSKHQHPSKKGSREACAPIGGELSITAGEPRANPRKGTAKEKGPHGVQRRLPRVGRRHTRGAARLPSVQWPARRSRHPPAGIPPSARRRREVRPHGVGMV